MARAAREARCNGTSEPCVRERQSARGYASRRTRRARPICASLPNCRWRWRTSHRCGALPIRTEVSIRGARTHSARRAVRDLRDLSDRMLARTGARPKIFLAALGSVSDFAPRATFARDSFRVGGIEALSNDGFSDRRKWLRHSALRREARVSLLLGRNLCPRRHGSGAGICNAGASVWVAGRPGKLEAALERAGICGFIFEGCDVPATLRKAYDRIAA